jgi:hypothetical protein
MPVVLNVIIRMEEMTNLFYANFMYQEAKFLLILSIALLISGTAFPQEGDKSFYLWRLHSISGEARLNGHYREQERIGLNFNEYQKSSFLSGGVFLKSNSSILHQNFLILDIDAGVMPETSRNRFIITPNQAEVSTLKKLGFNGTFLRQKKINFNLFGNYDESYSSRENLTDIKTLNRLWGGTLNYSNKVLPLSLNFSNKKWEERAIQDGRNYKMDQNTFGAQMNKNFTSHDRNELKYSHDENINVNQNLFRISNTTDNLDFSSFVNLGPKNKYKLNTLISDFSQRGYMNLKRFHAGENINILFII